MDQTSFVILILNWLVESKQPDQLLAIREEQSDCQTTVGRAKEHLRLVRSHSEERIAFDATNVDTEQLYGPLRRSIEQRAEAGCSTAQSAFAPRFRRCQVE
jgi:hypothetical protein